MADRDAWHARRRAGAAARRAPDERDRRGARHRRRGRWSSAIARDVARAPAGVRDPRDHASTATSRATASRRSAPTRRRSSPATSSRIDLRAVRRAFESVPWVRLAVVRRVWPNRLRVQLEEHRPVAIWGSESGAEKLVNSFGEVFEANLGDVEDDDLPTLAGPERQLGARAGDARPRRRRARAARRARRDAGAVGPRLVAATLDTGAVVELGRGSDDDVLARAARFVAHGRPGDVALPAPARVRRPAPPRRLRGAAEGRLDDDRRAPTRRRRRRREARWPRNSRIWSSASTSAPPR